jgi:hypothetical protein
MARKKNFHVVPRTGGWVVRKENNMRPTSIHTTQREAVEAARNMARSASGELVIHGKDGRIRERDSYSGRDPMPPREPRKVLFPLTESRLGKKAIRKAVVSVRRESSESPVPDDDKE